MTWCSSRPPEWRVRRWCSTPRRQVRERQGAAFPCAACPCAAFPCAAFPRASTAVRPKTDAFACGAAAAPTHWQQCTFYFDEPITGCLQGEVRHRLFFLTVHCPLHLPSHRLSLPFSLAFPPPFPALFTCLPTAFSCPFHLPSRRLSLPFTLAFPPPFLDLPMAFPDY